MELQMCRGNLVIVHFFGRKAHDMTINTEDLLNSILESLGRIEYIRAEDIPDIDLYMDQVTTFMGTHLKHSTRNPEEDKILTKTMINNYAKNDLLPPPVKKKYSKEHVMLLIFIYYYKGILSINDIQQLLRPITVRFFNTAGDYGLENIYEEAFGLEKEHIDLLKQDIMEKFRRSEQTYQDAPQDDRDFLQTFAFICMLSFDVYVKKLLIEKMIDGMRKEEPGRSDKKQKSKTEGKNGAGSDI